MRVEKLAGDAFSDVRYAVGFPEPAFVVGFKLISLIENLVYVTLQPVDLSSLRKSHFKALLEEFDKYSSYAFFCQTDTAEQARFTEFFGFYQDGYAYGRYHMKRDRR